MKLVIVESPNKCKTISKYLGDGYVVMASKGHLRDLAICGKDQLGIDFSNGFKPIYKINSDKYRVVNELRASAKKADEVILATDPDREGEAIAWHLAQILGLDPLKTKRLEFHEITKEAISLALKNPRTIDMDLVHAQETRRMVDRIIGFKISKVLQKKVNARSGGRVQSATLKLIADHEQTIRDFVPKEYWTIKAQFANKDKSFSADYFGENQKTVKIESEAQCSDLLSRLKDNAKVIKVTERTKYIDSKPPFTTPSLEQEAFSAYHFSTKLTASIAQMLYEGVDVNGEHIGLITYIRTDSIRLADSFIFKTKEYIKEKFGEEYVGYVKTNKKETKNMQDAHEAIRPTSIRRTPQMMQKYLTNEQYKLYKLIYDRALASLMKAKKEHVVTVILDVNGVNFKAEGRTTIFDGYTHLRPYGDDPSKELPPISEGEEYSIISIEHHQQFTEPPKPLNEGAIVKLMEEKGIGRPSTYATTINTLLRRQYVVSNKGNMSPTLQGEKTNTFLEEYFPTIVNTKYTADMEKSLDEISHGDAKKDEILSSFCEPFLKRVEYVSEKIAKLPKEQEETFGECPQCHSPLIKRQGKHGEFVGCSNYPKCHYIQKQESKLVYTGENCPVCNSPLVERYDSKGKKFIGCSNYPKCNYHVERPKVPPKLTGRTCPKCGGKVYQKVGPYGAYLECEHYKECGYRESLKKKYIRRS